MPISTPHHPTAVCLVSTNRDSAVIASIPNALVSQSVNLLIIALIQLLVILLVVIIGAS